MEQNSDLTVEKLKKAWEFLKEPVPKEEQSGYKLLLTKKQYQHLLDMSVEDPIRHNQVKNKIVFLDGVTYHLIIFE